MSMYYVPTQQEMDLIKCTDYAGNMSPMPLPSEYGKDWTLIPVVFDDKLFCTPFPDPNVLHAAIGQWTHAGLLTKYQQEYTADDGDTVFSNFFVDSMRRSVRKMKPTESGPGQSVANRTVRPNWPGGRQIDMTIGTLWTPAYKAELKVSLLRPESGAPHTTYKYPGRSRTLPLTDGGVARGTWPAYDRQDGESAIQKSLDALDCIAHPDVLKKAMTELDSWAPEIPQSVLSARSTIIPCWDENGIPTQAEIKLAVSIATPADKRLLGPLMV